MDEPRREIGAMVVEELGLRSRGASRGACRDVDAGVSREELVLALSMSSSSSRSKVLSLEREGMNGGAMRHSGYSSSKRAIMPRRVESRKMSFPVVVRSDELALTESSCR